MSEITAGLRFQQPFEQQSHQPFQQLQEVKRREQDRGLLRDSGRRALLAPDGSLSQRLRDLITHRKEGYTYKLRSQLGIDILRATPEERARNNIHIFAYLPDAELQSKLPLAVLNYGVWIADVFRPRRQGEREGLKFLRLSRFNFLPEYIDGELKLHNGELSKDVVGKLKEIDGLVRENSHLLNNPVLHLLLLRSILKSCDTYIKDLEINHQAKKLSGGNIERLHERDNSLVLKEWNGYKHTALARSLQYAMKVEELYDLGNSFTWITDKALGKTHKNFIFENVDIEEQVLLMEALGMTVRQPADKTVEIRDVDEADENKENENKNKRRSTRLNISALRQKVEDAAMGKGSVSEEELWLYREFCGI